MRCIDLSLTSDLQLSRAPDAEETYFLDFAFKDLDLFDVSIFNAYLLGVEAFAKAYPHAKKVVMATLDDRFAFIRTDLESYEEIQREMGLERDIVSATLFSDYLHRLASALPEEAVAVIRVLDCLKRSKARRIWLFCKRRFEHFELEFEHEPLPVVGSSPSILSLPQDPLFSVQRVDAALLQAPGCLCIPEELLNEHWDEASEIFYDPQTLGELGQRMLLGFEAAGGVIKKVR